MIVLLLIWLQTVKGRRILIKSLLEQMLTLPLILLFLLLLLVVGILQNPMVLPEQAHFTILKPLSKHL